MFSRSLRPLAKATLLTLFALVIGVFTVAAQETPEVTPEATEMMASAPATAAPEMQAVLDALAAFDAPMISDVNPHIARQLPTPADAVVSVLAANGTGYIPEPVADVSHILIPGAEEDLLARIYTPEGEGPFPVVVYFHGGGWVIANINVYDSSPRAIANAAGAIVVSVAYRQSPEVPFPGPVEDAYAATQWVIENAASFNGDPARVAVAGESAGGNMATVVTLMARDRGGALPIYQVLIYPVTQLVNLDTPSYVENADAAPLSRASAEWFFNYYTPDPATREDPYASPLLAEDLSGLPPAIVITAQIDPLRSEGEDYANALTEAGVSVIYQNYEGVAHEFFGMGAVVPQALDAVALVGDGLRTAFGN